MVLPVLLCMAGVAVDFTMGSVIKSELQAAADSAALAGARELALANANEKTIASVVRHQVEFHVDPARGPVSAEVSVNLETAAVVVVVEQSWAPFFMHFIEQGVTPVRTRAEARLLTGSTKICVLSLSPTDPKSVYLNDDAVLTATDCGVYANSAHSQAMRLDSNSRITASLICSAGGVKLNKLHYAAPPPTTDCPGIADPLADRPPPIQSACDFMDFTVADETKTLPPGVYCGGLEAKGSARISFGPGTYVIKDGPLRIGDDAVAEGVNVGFYLSGKAAVIDFRGNATIRLSGPEAGPLAGLLFFEDRSAPLRRKHRINSARTEKLVGTIYLPRGQLYIDPNATVAEKSAYTAIIAYELQLEQGPQLVLNADYTATKVPVPEGVRGQGIVVLSE